MLVKSELQGTFPWQQPQWQQLCNAYLNKKLPHAILLNGQKGLGKFQFAKAFAKFLFCSDQTKISSMKSCNTCKQCNLIEKEINPDLQILTLEEAATSIKLEQIKNLISHTNYTAQFNHFKAAIIYPAEKMNMAAANALLKNLEEPVGKLTLFILITHQQMNLPATIRSRCQRINFHGEVAPEQTQLDLLHKLNILFTNKSWLISDCTTEFNKIPIQNFIHGLQLTLANLIKFDDKISKTSLYYLLDKMNDYKKAFDSGISLNAQLVTEDCLSSIKNVT